MNPKSLQARWQVRAILPEDVPNAAVTLLESGADTPALRVLAGLHSATWWELHPWIERYFREAALGQMSDDEARWQLAYDTAREIVAGTITPLAGATALWHLCNDLGRPEPLRHFVYLAADYGEGPEDLATEAAWFDTKIVDTAKELLASEPGSGGVAKL